MAICVSCVGAFEGLRTVAYRDPIGIPTICFGSTAGVKLGDSKTVEECKALLETEILHHHAFLEKDSCVGKKAMDKLHPLTKAAVTSIIFNTGPGKYGVKDGVCELKKQKRPSTMALLLREGKTEEACHEFLKWANPPLPGIKKRRQVEMDMCLEGVRLQWTLSNYFWGPPLLVSWPSTLPSSSAMTLSPLRMTVQG